MSTSREVTVWCDECHGWTYGDGAPHRTAAKARQAAHRVGWKCRAGRDLCPSCVTVAVPPAPTATNEETP